MLDPDTITKALADLTRLRIVILLTLRDELCVCDLIDVLDMEQPKISRHLAVLRNARIVADRRSGQWNFYRLHPDLPRWAFAMVESLALGSSNKMPYLEDAQKLTLAVCHENVKAC